MGRSHHKGWRERREAPLKVWRFLVCHILAGHLRQRVAASEKEPAHG